MEVTDFLTLFSSLAITISSVLGIISRYKFPFLSWARNRIRMEYKGQVKSQELRIYSLPKGHYPHNSSYNFRVKILLTLFAPNSARSFYLIKRRYNEKRGSQTIG